LRSGRTASLESKLRLVRLLGQTLIRRILGRNVKTTHMGCTVVNIGGDAVQIESGYQAPLGPDLRYTAIGHVAGTNLWLDKIRVHGVDLDFILFSQFA
jgi:hypothetical protein